MRIRELAALRGVSLVAAVTDAVEQRNEQERKKANAEKSSWRNGS